MSGLFRSRPSPAASRYPVPPVLPASGHARGTAELAVRCRTGHLPCVPASGVPGTHSGAQGGDFFDLIDFGDGRMLLQLLDVSGRGAAVQELLAELQDVFQVRGRELFAPDAAGHDVNANDGLMQLVPELNRRLMTVAGGVHYASAALAHCDCHTGIFTYIVAGAPPILLKRGDHVEQLQGTGLPLGLFTHSTYEAEVIAVEPGAALMLFSKGLVEVECRHQQFGLERTRQALGTFSAEGAAGLCESLLDAAMRFEQQPTRFGPPLRFPGFREQDKAADMTVIALLRRV